MRSARFINSRGHLTAGGMKDGLLSLEAQKQDEMMFMELALRVRMRHEFDAEFGEVHFSMSYRDKVIVMSFPLNNDDVLLVSCEKEMDLINIPFPSVSPDSPQLYTLPSVMLASHSELETASDWARYEVQ